VQKYIFLIWPIFSQTPNKKERRKYYYKRVQEVLNLLQYKAPYYRLWIQARGSIHISTKEKEDLRPIRPVNQHQEIALMSSTNGGIIGNTPLKTTLLRNFLFRCSIKLYFSQYWREKYRWCN
jgi:hypothetical protein